VSGPGGKIEEGSTAFPSAYCEDEMARETGKQDEQAEAPIPGLLDGTGVDARLRSAGIPLTLQRLAVGQVMLCAPVHLTADQVLARVKGLMPEISRATVYNTLKLFSEKGLVRELIIDADRTVFDSNTVPHPHIYNTDTGELTDIAAGDLKVVGSATLPDGLEVEAVDIVVRVRKKAAAS
jgi:Fur family transcriptional regulator, iron response regulator